VSRCLLFFFQAGDGIRYRNVTGVQTCALPIYVVASIQWAQGFAEVNLYNSDIVSITKVDDLTVEIKTDGPDAMLLSNLCHHGNEIGRASCRERASTREVDDAGEGKGRMARGGE